jgi:predicted RNase H-like nuclease (RuvC/YqgF family)
VSAEEHPNNNWSSKYGNILQTMTVVGVALGGVYAGVIAPIHEGLRDLQVKVDQIRPAGQKDMEKVSNFFLSEIKDKLTKEEHVEFKLRVDKTIEGLQTEISSLRAEVSYLRDNQVTRQEHVTHWDQIKENFFTMSGQIDSLRKDFGGQYTVGEEIKQLQGQINDLRNQPRSLQLPQLPLTNGAGK